MKSILAVAVLLATIGAAILLVTNNTANAQLELGDAHANNPMMARTLPPLFFCQEAVIRANFVLPRDEKDIKPLVLDRCAKEIDNAQEACGVVTNYSDDDCETIINNLLRRNSRDVVKDIMSED